MAPKNITNIYCNAINLIASVDSHIIAYKRLILKFLQILPEFIDPNHYKRTEKFIEDINFRLAKIDNTIKHTLVLLSKYLNRPDQSSSDNIILQCNKLSFYHKYLRTNNSIRFMITDFEDTIPGWVDDFLYFRINTLIIYSITEEDLLTARQEKYKSTQNLSHAIINQTDQPMEHNRPYSHLSITTQHDINMPPSHLSADSFIAHPPSPTDIPAPVYLSLEPELADQESVADTEVPNASENSEEELILQVMATNHPSIQLEETFHRILNQRNPNKLPVHLDLYESASYIYKRNEVLNAKMEEFSNIILPTQNTQFGLNIFKKPETNSSSLIGNHSASVESYITDVNVEDLLNMIKYSDPRRLDIDFYSLEDLLACLSTYTYFALSIILRNPNDTNLLDLRNKRKRAIVGAVNYLKKTQSYARFDCNSIIEDLVIKWFKAFISENIYISSIYYDSKILESILSNQESQYLKAIKSKHYFIDVIYSRKLPAKALLISSVYSYQDLKTYLTSTYRDIDEKQIEQIYKVYSDIKDNIFENKTLYLVEQEVEDTEKIHMEDAITVKTSRFHKYTNRYYSNLNTNFEFSIEVPITYRLDFIYYSHDQYMPSSHMYIENFTQFQLYVLHLYQFTQYFIKNQESNSKSDEYRQELQHQYPLLNVNDLLILEKTDIEMLSLSTGDLYLNLTFPLYQYMLNALLKTQPISTSTAHNYFFASTAKRPTPILLILKEKYDSSILDFKEYISYIIKNNLNSVFNLNTDYLDKLEQAFINSDNLSSDIFQYRMNIENLITNLNIKHRESKLFIHESISALLEIDTAIQIPIRESTILNHDTDHEDNYTNAVALLTSRLNTTIEYSDINLYIHRINDPIEKYRKLEIYLSDNEYFMSTIAHNMETGLTDKQEFARQYVIAKAYDFYSLGDNILEEPGVIESKTILDGVHYAITHPDNFELTPEILSIPIKSIPELAKIAIKLKPILYQDISEFYLKFLNKHADRINKYKDDIFNLVVNITGREGDLYNLYNELFHMIPFNPLQSIIDKKTLDMSYHNIKSVLSQFRDSEEYIIISRTISSISRLKMNEEMKIVADTINFIYQDMKLNYFFGTSYTLNNYIQKQLELYELVKNWKDLANPLKIWEVIYLANMIELSAEYSDRSVIDITPQLTQLHETCYKIDEMIYTNAENNNYIALINIGFYVILSNYYTAILNTYTKSSEIPNQETDTPSQLLRFSSTNKPIYNFKDEDFKTFITGVLRTFHHSLKQSFDNLPYIEVQISSLDEIIQWHYTTCALCFEDKSKNAPSITRAVENYNILPLPKTITSETLDLEKVYKQKTSYLVATSKYMTSLRITESNGKLSGVISERELYMILKVERYYNRYMFGNNFEYFYREIAPEIECRNYRIKKLTEFNYLINDEALDIAYHEKSYYQNCDLIASSVAYKNQYEVYISQFLIADRDVGHNPESDSNVIMYTRRLNKIYVCYTRKIYKAKETSIHIKSVSSTTRCGRIEDASIVSFRPSSNTKLSRLLFDKYLSEFGINQKTWFLPNQFLHNETVFENLHILHKDGLRETSNWTDMYNKQAIKHANQNVLETMTLIKHYNYVYDPILNATLEYNANTDEKVSDENIFIDKSDKAIDIGSKSYKTKYLRLNSRLYDTLIDLSLHDHDFINIKFTKPREESINELFISKGIPQQAPSEHKCLFKYYF